MSGTYAADNAFSTAAAGEYFPVLQSAAAVLTPRVPITHTSTLSVQIAETARISGFAEPARVSAMNSESISAAAVHKRGLMYRIGIFLSARNNISFTAE